MLASGVMHESAGVVATWKTVPVLGACCRGLFPVLC